MFDLLSIIGALSIIFVAVCIILILMIGIASMVNKIYDRRDKSKAENWRKHIASELDSIDKWCGYEFPELASLARTLIPVVKDEKGFGVDRYRQELRRMPRKLILSIDGQFDAWIELSDSDDAYSAAIKLRSLASDLENKSINATRFSSIDEIVKKRRLTRIALSVGADGIVS